MFNHTIYVRIDAGRLELLHAQSGREWADTAEVARHGPTGKVLAVGQEALTLRGSTDISHGNGFLHPRTPIADFVLAEIALKALIRRVMPRSWLAIAPTLVIHPVGRFDGGLTQVEIRALHELARGAGARRSLVWHGEGLDRAQLIAQAFGQAHGRLLN